MKRQWWLLLAVLILAGGSLGATLIGKTGTGRKELSQEEFIQQYPDALIYEGLALYDRKDYRGAVAAWERYLKLAPKGTDWVSVPELIQQARTAISGSRK